jgi:hypothetical protein
MPSQPRELLEFLYGYDPAIQSLALGLRKVIHEEMAPCHERIFAMRSKVVLWYSATERVIADGICGISVMLRHVTLVFTRGTELHDPTRILEGTGKKMRHVRLKRLSDLDRPEIRLFLRRARRRAGMPPRNARTAGEVVTTVKRKPVGTFLIRT